MSLLEEIDKLRDDAAVLAKGSRDPGYTPAQYEEIRDLLTQTESEINDLLLKYIDLPDCPHKGCPGKMEETPTKHVRMCTKCQAVLLPGRMVPFLHVEIT